MPRRLNPSWDDFSLRSQAWDRFWHDAIDFTPSADLAFDSVTLAPAIADLVVDWTIDELSLEPVASDLGIDYAVTLAGGVGRSLTFTYKVTKPTPTSQVRKDLKPTWRIDAYEQVGKDFKPKWKIIGATIAGASLPFGWGIDPSPSVVGVDLPFDDEVTINTIVGLDLDLEGVVLANTVVGADLAFEADIELSRPRANLTFDHALEQPVPSAELGLDWAIVGVPTTTSSHDGGGGRARRPIVIYERRRRPEPERPPRIYAVGASLELDQTIRTSAGANLWILSTVMIRAGRNLKQDYVVRNRIRKSLPMDYGIIDWYDTNLDVLLAEIDEDLALIA